MEERTETHYKFGLLKKGGLKINCKYWGTGRPMLTLLGRWSSTTLTHKTICKNTLCERFVQDFSKKQKKKSYLNLMCKTMK